MLITTISLSLVALGFVLNFIKDIYNSKPEERNSRLLILSIGILILGIGGTVVSFIDSKNTYHDKLISDSTASSKQHNYDSILQIQLNYLGAGNIKPLLSFVQMSPVKFYILIGNQDKYSLKDIRISIQDEDALANFNKSFYSTSNDSAINERDKMIARLENSNQYSKEILLSYLNATDSRFLESIDVQNKTHLKYRIDVNWSNGWITYYIECFKSASRWTETRKEYDHKTGITINN
ncbi:MAG TPA: hypothetical protein VKT28_21310 [Puia sp.]|nr:hypothetical protein [Puia sp.]